MEIFCIADDLHEKSSLIFLGKKNVFIIIFSIAYHNSETVW